MIRIVIPLCLALGACTTIQETADQAGRDAAKTIMPETLAVFFPDVPKAFYTPFTNCVVDNADKSEVQSLAGDAVVGVDADTAAVVRTILERPETQQCLSTSVSADVLSF